MSSHLYKYPLLLFLSHLGASSLTDYTIKIAPTDTEKQTKLIEEIFTRPATGSYYETDTSGRIHFIQDLMNFHEKNIEHQVTREAKLYFMEAPSMLKFATNIDNITTNSIILGPIDKKLNDANKDNSTNSNPLFNAKGSNTAFFYLNRGMLTNKDIDPNNITSESENFYPRAGSRPSGDFPFTKFVGSPHTMVRQHFTNFCDNYGDSASDLCTTLSGDVNATPKTDNPSADMNAESLFAPTDDPLATVDYIQNITDPFPKNIFAFTTDGKADTDQNDHKTLANAIVDKSYRSLSQYTLNDIKNRHLNQVASGGASTSSLHSIIEEMATSRIKSESNWLQKIESTSTEGLLREIALIEASRLFIDYVQLRQNEHMEALLAAMVAQNQNLTQILDFSSGAGVSDATSVTNDILNQ